MRLIAHRGFAGIAPENTVAAVRSACERADAVEVDVRRCGSGELVVVHDETLDRIAGGPGTVADSRLDHLKTHTVLESGERIPTLAEVLDVVPPTVDLVLEVKATGVAADVLEAVSAVDNRVLLTSFRESELRAIRDLDPDQAIGLLVSRRLDAALSTAVELDCDVVGANYLRCLATRIVPRAKALGFEVHAWPIDRPLVARALAARGVDCVIADRPLGV